MDFSKILKLLSEIEPKQNILNEDMKMVTGTDGKKVPDFAADGKGKNDLKKNDSKEESKDEDKEEVEESINEEEVDEFLDNKVTVSGTGTGGTSSSKNDNANTATGGTSSATGGSSSANSNSQSGAESNSTVDEEVVDEVAAPGQEDWIKSNKERFMKQYGKNKGMSVLYATAWKRSKDAKSNESLEECWDQAMDDQVRPDQESGMNISSNLNTQTGSKSLTVTAQGEAAEQLAQILKLAGMAGGSAEYHEPEIQVSMEEEYANEPQPEIQPVSTQLQQGNDLNRMKKQDPATANPAANPLARSLATAESLELQRIEKRLMEELDSIKMTNEIGDVSKTSKGGKIITTKAGQIHKAGPKGHGYLDKSDEPSAEKKATKSKDIELPAWKGNVTTHKIKK